MAQPPGVPHAATVVHLPFLPRVSKTVVKILYLVVSSVEETHRDLRCHMRHQRRERLWRESLASCS